jgi:hypothetical protein
MSGKQLVGKILQITGCILGASLIALALWVFLVDHYDPTTGIHYDGFGRQLYASSGFFGRELSPGLLWEIVDTGLAIVAFGIVSGLFSVGTKMQRPHQR